MKFIDFFSGIGGFRLGLEQVGHKCIGHCEIDKYANRSYIKMHNPKEGEWFTEDVNTVNPESIPKADLWTFGFPCFAKGTLVKTPNGYKEIQNIREGDLVFTHKGRYKKVLTPMINLVQSIYKLKIFGSEPILVTEQHPFYVRHMSRIWNNKKRSYNRIFSDPEWIKVKDLNIGDYVGIPINTESEIPEWNGIEYRHKNTTKVLNNLELKSNLFWWIVGRYFGDGWTIHYKRKDEQIKSRVIISCAKNIANDLKDKIEVMFHVCKSDGNSASKLIICNKELAIFLDQFGKGAANKFIDDKILNLPEDLLKSFIDGYLSSDGCYTQNQWTAVTISRHLAYGIASCIHKVYKRPVCLYRNKVKKTTIIEGRKVNQKNSFTISFHKEERHQDQAFYENNYIWVPIREIKLKEYNNYVYNMEVEEDNSYTANNISCHNCQDISIAGKQKGIKSKRSGLFFTVMQLLQEIKEEDKPEWLLIENVKNLFSINGGRDFLRILLELDENGFDARWQLINSKHFGVAQNRERIFIVANLRSRCSGEVLPIIGENGNSLKELVSGAQAFRVYDPNGISCAIKSSAGGVGAKTGLYLIPCLINRGKLKVQTDGNTNCIQTTYPQLSIKDQRQRTIILEKQEGLISNCIDANYYKGIDNHGQRTGIIEVIPCLTPERATKRQNGRRFKEPGDPAFTLTSQDRHGVLIQYAEDNFTNYRIRRLTPRECFRLQGFPDEYFDKAASVNSDSQLYKQAGNSVTVNVIREIGKKLREIESNNND